MGFVINSVTMIAKLMAEKALKLQHDCLIILKRQSISIREAARIIGKIVSSFPRVMYGPLHYRHLEHDKTDDLGVVYSKRGISYNCTHSRENLVADFQLRPKSDCLGVET